LAHLAKSEHHQKPGRDRKFFETLACSTEILEEVWEENKRAKLKAFDLIEQTSTFIDSGIRYTAMICLPDNLNDMSLDVRHDLS